MKLNKRTFFWVFLFACGVLGIWWLFYVPYRPERLLDAIPAKSAFITTHKRVAERWDDVADNPLTISLLRSAGVHEDQLRVLGEDPAFRLWLERLAFDTIALAYVPAMQVSGRPAWVFSSWLGGDSRVMRFAMFFKRFTGLERRQTRSGGSYWVVPDAALEKDLAMAISFIDGMLVGCISTRDSDIEELIDTLDGKHASIVTAGSWGGHLRDKTVTDCGWLRASAWGGTRWRGDPSLTYELFDVRKESLAGRVVLSDVAALSADVDASPDVEGLDRIFGDLPMGVVVGRPSLLAPVLDPVPAAILQDMEGRQGSETMAVAVVGEEYSGRIARLFKVPALLFATKTRDERGAIEFIERAMDRLNAEYQWGLIHRKVPMAERMAYVIETTTSNSYQHLAPEERIAYTVLGDWLVLASHREALLKLMSRYDREDSRDGADPRWQAGLAHHASPLGVWFDLDAARKPLRLAVKLLEISQLKKDSSGSEALRDRLNLARIWIDALASFHMCNVWVNARETATEIRFEMGE